MKNSIWQSWMELVGRPFKNALIAAAIFILVAFCGFAAFLSSAIESFYQSFADMAGYSVVAEIDSYFEVRDWTLILEAAARHEHILGYNNAISVQELCSPVDFVNLPYDGSIADTDSEMVCINGNINAAYNDYFRNEEFKLIDGGFPSDNHAGVLIEKNLASRNSLSVGDTLKLEWHGNQKTLPIIGIYEVLRSPRVEAWNGYYQVFPNSILFCDYETYADLTGVSNCTMITFYIDEYDNMKNCYAYITDLVSEIQDSVVIDAIANQEVQMSEVIASLRKMTIVTIDVVYILCVVIMSLLIILWLRGHSKMIAIYQTLGQRPFYVIRILLLEILFVTVPPVCLSAFLALFVIDKYSNEMFFMLLNFCEVNSAEQNFSAGMWNFRMNKTMLFERTAILELAVVALTVIGSIIFLKKTVRELRQME